MVDKSVNNFTNEVDDDTMSSVYNAWRKNLKSKRFIFERIGIEYFSYSFFYYSSFSLLYFICVCSSSSSTFTNFIHSIQNFFHSWIFLFILMHGLWIGIDKSNQNKMNSIWLDVYVWRALLNTSKYTQKMLILQKKIICWNQCWKRIYFVGN